MASCLVLRLVAFDNIRRSTSWHLTGAFVARRTVLLNKDYVG